jgi:hypothetical protein
VAQFDYGNINPLQVGGSELASDLNAWRDAMHTMHAGTTRPAYVKTYMLWWDTAAAPSQARLKIFTGSTDVVLATLNLGNGSLSLGGSIAFNGLAISWWHPGLGRLAIWQGSTWVDAMETPAIVSAANTAAPNFPPGVAVGTVYTAANGVTYTWNGQRWVATAPAWVRSAGDTMSGPLGIVSSDARLTVRNSGAQAGSKLDVVHGGDTQTRFDMASSAGITAAMLMDFNLKPGNLAADVNVRFFRDTQTSGRKKLVFFPGDGSANAIGGIEVDKTASQVKPYGPWNFTEKMFAAGNFQHPFQIGSRRIWQNSSSGQLLFKDGSDPINDADGAYLVPLASLTPPNIYKVATNANVSVPAGISAAYVTLIGGGGGGGGTATGANAKGGGGGGGGYVEGIVSSLTPGQLVSVVCGRGGNGGVGNNGGQAGTNSAFGTWLAAVGGQGGGGSNSGAAGGGNGGNYIMNNAVVVIGDPGQKGGDAFSGGSGWGGLSGGYYNTNGDRGDGIEGYSSDGSTATAAGNGGGGANNNSNAATRTGGQGADGLVIITWI